MLPKKKPLMLLQLCMRIVRLCNDSYIQKRQIRNQQNIIIFSNLLTRSCEDQRNINRLARLHVGILSMEISAV